MHNYEDTLRNSRLAIRYLTHNPERVNDPAIIPALRTMFHLHQAAAEEVLETVKAVNEPFDMVAFERHMHQTQIKETI